jgi:hypothetical protein
MAGEVREANHEAVGLASGWQVAKQLTQQVAQQTCNIRETVRATNAHSPGTIHIHGYRQGTGMK